MSESKSDGISIDPEFHSLIFPLSRDELSGLETSLKEEGLRDSLICWRGLLLDGHNRFEICNRLGIPIRKRHIKLLDRCAAKQWIIANQLNRRNLTAWQRGQLALTRKRIFEESAKERMVSGVRMDPQHFGAEGHPKYSNWTDYKLGELAKVSHKTMHQIRYLDKHATEEAKGRLARGETTIHREYHKLRPTKKPKHKDLEARREKIQELASSGHRAAQIAEDIGISENLVKRLAKEASIRLPDAMISNRRRIDVNRIIEHTVIDAQSLVAGLELVDSRLDDLRTDHIDEWIPILSASVSAINHLIAQLKRRRGQNEQQNGSEVRDQNNKHKAGTQTGDDIADANHPRFTTAAAAAQN